MCSRYVSESSLISLMARVLKSLPTLEDKPRALHTLLLAGFEGHDIRDFIDRAIESERMRRAAFAYRER
jgi:hypothetical protein